MAVTIQNKMKRPVMIRLNSGLIYYLSAGCTSEKIIDVEVRNNEKLNRLLSRDIIILREVKIKAAKKTMTEKK